MTVETIVAQATASGRAGVGIVRISGPLSQIIAQQIVKKELTARQAVFCDFHHPKEAVVIDQGVALYFAGPHSFTGEDVLELHAHGSPIVLGQLVEAAISLGARMARPGEFSERAFLNDKMDLAQAEAVADLIDSHSQQSARAAVRSLQGIFSAKIQALVTLLIELRIFVEAAIDFPEEEVDFLTNSDVGKRLQTIHGELETIIANAHCGAVLREGMTIVIAGQPNVGKSSLLNQLSGRDSAIVTDIPGTTRDVMREHIIMDGIPLHVIDTAGLRDSDDPVEQEGIRRAKTALESADHILLMVDESQVADKTAEQLLQQFADHYPENTPVTLVRNKIDLTADAQTLVEEAVTAIKLSAKTGLGIDLLRQRLKHCAGMDQLPEDSFIARTRHVDALTKAAGFVTHALDQFKQRQGELIAEDLRQAQQCLGEITGEFTADDLLGEIFASFCIGK